jgi:hypothetical protein
MRQVAVHDLVARLGDRVGGTRATRAGPRRPSKKGSSKTGRAGTHDVDAAEGGGRLRPGRHVAFFLEDGARGGAGGRRDEFLRFRGGAPRSAISTFQTFWRRSALAKQRLIPGCIVLAGKEGVLSRGEGDQR